MNSSGEKERRIEQIEKRISNARLSIAIDFPFFGYLLAGINFNPVDTAQGLTISTNGDVIIYSPKYVDSLSNDQLLFALSHDILHCALEHIQRRKSRSKPLWNLASDILVNEILIHNEIGEPPPDTVRAPEHVQLVDITSRSVEEIYHELLSKQEKQEQPKFWANFDQHFDPTTKDEQESKQTTKQEEQKPEVTPKVQETPDAQPQSKTVPKPEQFLAEIYSTVPKQNIEWSLKIAQAMVFAKTQGSTPKGVEQEYEISVKGQLPWQRILAQYIQQTLAFDTSYRHPNRRYISRNLYLPGIEKTGLKAIIGLDTSGSITDFEASVFISETFAILRQFHQVDIILIQCDAKVHDVRTFSSRDPPPKTFQMIGRGGTDFRPVFDYIIEKRIIADVMIYLTDGYGEYPERNDLKIPVLWVLTERKVKVPFGRTIFFPPWLINGN